MRIVTIKPGELERYREIPISYTVSSVFEVIPADRGLGGIILLEKVLEEAYVKDYDEMGDPSNWLEDFHVSNWLFLLAMDGNTPVGGATVAYDTPGVNMLAGRTDMAVLWDIRVHPEHRGRGVGTRLFRRAASWASAKGCIWLKIETQNINVPACKFYAGMGCILGEINAHAYKDHELVHETMLVWYLGL